MPRTRFLAEQASRERFWLRLLGFFSGLAVLLAAVGLYGVISYSVAQRSHEFGIRMALGAQRIDVLREVIKRGLWLSIAGVVIVVIAALGLTPPIESQLYGVTPRDPATLATVSVLLIAVALLANFVPARRATKVAPMVALRQG